MSNKPMSEAGFGSDAKKDPRRIVFITKKTSAKVKGDVGPQVMSYPHVIIREMIAFQILTIVLVVIALLWDAPLEQLANPLLTPNPAKAPSRGSRSARRWKKRKPEDTPRPMRRKI